MKAKIIRTSVHNEKLKEICEMKFDKFNNLSNLTVVINPKQTYQSILGFGGAFTESSGYVFSKLSKEEQDTIINAYYSEEGLKYNFGRVHINSCDFALNNYYYVENGDFELNTFDISREEKYVIPMIKKAYNARKDKINLLASPWSPPDFMKNNFSMNYGGKLERKYYHIWAKYIIKFIKEYEKRDLNIWGITIQNEPLATQTWDSCIYEAEDERDFVKIIGPMLEKEKIDVNILCWDHNRGDILVSRNIKIFEDKVANKYLWGIANHWYCSDDFSSLERFHMAYPDKSILFTEGCVEYSIYGNENSIKDGEQYAYNIIGDFNHYSRGFIDWNLLLDQQGGPNHVKNFCGSPIMYDFNKKEIIFNYSYYYIGHFSKYIEPGAKRIASVISNENEDVYITALKNPNDEIVVVILNKGYIKELDLVINHEKITLSLPDHSIQTLIIN